MNKLYISIIVLVFCAFTIVFDTFPRSTFSELEKRDLATLPEFSWQRLFDGSYTKAVSQWFSDSEPYRDHFMAMSMNVKDGQKLVVNSDDNVTFHASTDAPAAPEAEVEEAAPEPDDRNVGEYHNDINADGTAKIANAGIIIVGSGKNVRALMAYGGSSRGGVPYAQAANKYKETFGSAVNVYCMVIPTSTEFYTPDKARKMTNPQRPTINNIYAHLSPEVKAVDAYTALATHAKEDIYLRTDHHWAPLGAYYAAQRFAQVAGVPFQDLNHYERRVVHGYVGSMYGYSKDASVKNAPEDFVYYVPQGVTYTTYYTDYTIDKNYKVTGEGKPHKGIFFNRFRDGSGAAYCTFMGSDTRITRVETSTKNGRRLLILKDSFGNALPGYLFFSFEEVHVIDSRYFTRNMKAYVKEHKVTDILFANNIMKAYSPHIYKNYLKFLQQ